jgi:hypothetical protein
MRAFVSLFLVLVAIQVWAQPPTYDYVRKTVEGQNPKDNIPAAERVFVSYNYTDGIIVRFRNGITLREIIDASTRKGKAVQAVVLRKIDDTDKPVFGGQFKPSDKPTFTVKPQDVIFLQEPNTPY